MFIGADSPNRTDDRMITNHLLYLLSYIGIGASNWAIEALKHGAVGETRTLTSKTPEPKSGASTNFATTAWRKARDLNS